jgi:hypothetical protein
MTTIFMKMMVNFFMVSCYSSFERSYRSSTTWTEYSEDLNTEHPKSGTIWFANKLTTRIWMKLSSFQKPGTIAIKWYHLVWFSNVWQPFCSIWPENQTNRLICEWLEKKWRPVFKYPAEMYIRPLKTRHFQYSDPTVSLLFRANVINLSLLPQNIFYTNENIYLWIFP